MESVSRTDRVCNEGFASPLCEGWATLTRLETMGARIASDSRRISKLTRLRRTLLLCFESVDLAPRVA